MYQKVINVISPEVWPKAKAGPVVDHDKSDCSKSLLQTGVSLDHKNTPS